MDGGDVALLGKRPPPNVEYPAEQVCKWCGGVVQRHCKSPTCCWYPCHPCTIVTVLSGLHLHEGAWKWNVTWTKVDSKFWSA